MRAILTGMLCAAALGASGATAAAADAYKLGESRHLPIRSFDGTMLDGWVHLPDVPEGTRVPVVLSASPYWGNLAPAASQVDQANAGNSAGLPFMEFIERGYGVALYNTRGSGSSEGCNDLVGPNERRDMKVLVEDLAGRDFSTGRVATIGKSYAGSTALAAAAEKARGLRLAIATHPMTDLYTVMFTPQGAAVNMTPQNWLLYQGYTLPPPVDRSGAAAGLAEYPDAATGWLCPDVERQLRALALDMTSEERDAVFWRQRRLLEDLAASTTPVLLVGGFRDRNVLNFQEYDWWRALRRGPRRLLLSQGGHVWPTKPGFNAEVLAWLDHYLRGEGPEPETVGRVEYEAHPGGWRSDTAWPPRQRAEEVLYLGGRSLRTQPGGTDRSYLTNTEMVNSHLLEDALRRDPVCPGSIGDDTFMAAYFSDAVASPTVVAGAAMAYLRLTSDQPGGIVEVGLYKVPAGSCGGAGTKFLGFGMADLRFHQGFTARDFPTGTPTSLRIDLDTTAERLAPGDRLAITLSGGESFFSHRIYTPTITVHADGDAPSQIVLPVVEGGFGAQGPRTEYPPRAHALEDR